MFSISEDWTSCYIITENEDDFMGNLYDHGFFWYYKIIIIIIIIIKI
jgi:hypothetical protein